MPHLRPPSLRQRYNGISINPSLLRASRALHDQARIPLVLNLPHKLSRIAPGALALQLHDEHAGVVLVEAGGQALALHQGGDRGLDLGDVRGRVVAFADDEAELGEPARAAVLQGA